MYIGEVLNNKYKAGDLIISSIDPRLVERKFMQKKNQANANRIWRKAKIMTTTIKTKLTAMPCRVDYCCSPE